MTKTFIACFTLALACLGPFDSFAQKPASRHGFYLNQRDYLQNQGVDVMLAQDFYPEGHQGGVGIIQQGERVATNGDIRLEPTPGQWSPIPKVGKPVIDRAGQVISVSMSYPDSAIDRKGFNPVIYPDLHFSYVLSVRPAGEGFLIDVDLDKPIPDEWIGRVGFNLELFPGSLFGKSYYMDRQAGVFPRQAYDQMVRDVAGDFQVSPMAMGRKLTIAPESEAQRMTIECVRGGDLMLLDGRGKYSNGWYVVRSLVPKGATAHAIEWLVTPHAIPGWISDPVVQVSQVGYHPMQQKVAVIELDALDKRRLEARLVRIDPSGNAQTVLSGQAAEWGNFLRYHYLQFDFSRVREPGIYEVRYGDYRSATFRIGDDIYREDVWQPTLEYFLPVQMCHMRVNDKYRVWHGACHMDDALMAPIDSDHFDGYIQGPSTLTSFSSGQHVPLLNRGGWHDAGDYDIRVESQAETVLGLTLAYETFGVTYDNTTVDQEHHVVEIQVPDGKPDMLQQVEHGLLTLVGSYESMGRFYRGIIEPTMRQYTHLGDPVDITDNVPGNWDDRWVFTEDNPGRSLLVASSLAAAARVMKGYNDTLAASCLRIAEEVWDRAHERDPLQRVGLAVELLVTTGDERYADFLVSHTDEIAHDIDNTGWMVARTLPLISDAHYHEALRAAVRALYTRIQADGLKTPYGVPYRPNIWGAGWDIQHFGFKQYFLHTYFPDIVGKEYMLDALNFILGVHPGSNTASFVSGVGAKSMTVAYGFNRADWTFIPGGVASGTALIRPDFPELKVWPFFWQQGEYVLGGGTTDYLFLVLAANKVLSEDAPRAAASPAAWKLAIADSMERSLRHELLAPWYPRCYDTAYGGFRSAWTYDFQPASDGDKMIVTQARHIWVNAKASERYPDVPYYRYGATLGYHFLRDKMWDPVYGGFYTLVDRAGNPKPGFFGSDKDAYGNAFAIYALSAYYHATGDTAALGLAKRTFWWLEAHSHDPVYLGYYQHLHRDGTHVLRTADVPTTAETGYKDQNSSIHLLEALTELYGVWKDSLLRARVQEMLHLIRDKIVDPRGNLTLFFHPDWTPVTYRDSSRAVILAHRNLDHCSFGHDVETAYLMLEASEALGGSEDDQTLAVGKRMVDDALRNGWDPVRGGFYDEGYYFPGSDTISIILNTKNWWAQAEGMNALLLMGQRFPNDPMHYDEKFRLLWKYVETYLIDHKYGDWYDEGLDNAPDRRTALKGQIWKATYHHYRALVNCIARLEAF